MTTRDMCPECDQYIGPEPWKHCPNCGAALADLDQFLGDEEYGGDEYDEAAERDAERDGSSGDLHPAG